MQNYIDIAITSGMATVYLVLGFLMAILGEGIAMCFISLH